MDAQRRTWAKTVRSAEGQVMLQPDEYSDILKNTAFSNSLTAWLKPMTSGLIMNRLQLCIPAFGDS